MSTARSRPICHLVPGSLTAHQVAGAHDDRVLTLGDRPTEAPPSTDRHRAAPDLNAYLAGWDTNPSRGPHSASINTSAEHVSPARVASAANRRRCIVANASTRSLLTSIGPKMQMSIATPPRDDLANAAIPDLNPAAQPFAGRPDRTRKHHTEYGLRLRSGHRLELAALPALRHRVRRPATCRTDRPRRRPHRRRRPNHRNLAQRARPAPLPNRTAHPSDRRPRRPARLTAGPPRRPSRPPRDRHAR